jgi:hypothetical protein
MHGNWPDLCIGPTVDGWDARRCITALKLMTQDTSEASPLTAEAGGLVAGVSCGHAEGHGQAGDCE